MFISCGHFTKKCLLFFLLPIAMFLDNVLISLTEDKNLFFHWFLKYVGRSITGILWFVFEREIVSSDKDKQYNEDTKLVKNDQNNTPQDNSEILNEDEFSQKNNASIQYELDLNKKMEMKKKKERKLLCFLIIICVLDFISQVCQITVFKSIYHRGRSGGLVSLTVVARLFAIAILSYFIIKNTKMNRHHYLSIIILIIVVIIINIFSCSTETDHNKDYFSKFLIMILPELLFSIMYVYGEKYLRKSKGNVYKLLFFDGIIGIILSILSQIIIYCSHNCDSNHGFFYEDFCTNNQKTFIGSFGFDKLGLISIPVILVNFCEGCLIWLLIYNFSANHFGAIYSIQIFSYCLTINKIGPMQYIVYSLGGIIIVFATFVYNEIIILRFCNLDKNTAVEINKRALEDFGCDFGVDEEDIHDKSNDNYLIMKEDLEETPDENGKNK